MATKTEGGYRDDFGSVLAWVNAHKFAPAPLDAPLDAQIAAEFAENVRSHRVE